MRAISIDAASPNREQDLGQARPQRQRLVLGHIEMARHHPDAVSFQRLDLGGATLGQCDGPARDAALFLAAQGLALGPLLFALVLETARMFYREQVESST